MMPRPHYIHFPGVLSSNSILYRGPGTLNGSQFGCQSMADIFKYRRDRGMEPVSPCLIFITLLMSAVIMIHSHNLHLMRFE